MGNNVITDEEILTKCTYFSVSRSLTAREEGVGGAKQQENKNEKKDTMCNQ